MEVTTGAYGRRRGEGEYEEYIDESEKALTNWSRKGKCL